MSNVLSAKHRKVRKFNLDGQRDPKRSPRAKKRTQYLRQQRAIKRSQFS